MANRGEQSSEDIERGYHISASNESEEKNHCFSDAKNQSWHSTYGSNSTAAAYDDYRVSGALHDNAEGFREPCRKSCVSEASVGDDLEICSPEIKLNIDKDERICRICHLSLEKAAPESGVPIVLGCSCKDDLAAAHKQCAETWFKIKGNKTCEICGSIACNVVGPGETEVMGQLNDAHTSTASSASPSETRRFWQGHRFLNFMLACLVFAFVISWLLHFNVPG